jgi:hypothetical protein
MLRDADRHYLTVFLREGKDDGRMLLRLLGSWGLCARHANDLVQLEPVERGDGLGTGTLYDWLMDQARRRLADIQRDLDIGKEERSARRRQRRTARQRKEQLLRRLARATSCPACESQRQYADYVVQGFVRALESAAELPGVPDMYLASDGLCVPHWQAIPTLRPSAGVREMIAAKQREVVASLKAALDAELDRGIEEDVSQGGQQHEPVYARALATVAGDTEWHPPAR